MRYFILSCLAVIVSLLMAVECRSAETASDPEALKIAQEFIEKYTKNFNAGDSKALAAMWKTDGEMVDVVGTRLLGREAIEKAFSEFFASFPGRKNNIELIHARRDREGVLVVEIVPKVTPPVTTAISQVGAVVVLVREKNGQWFIEGVREKDPLPASYEHLKELEWMVGDWTVNPKKAGQVVLSFNCHWTENKSFLIRAYTAKYMDTVLHGTEVIGWDAKEKKIRAWSFSSNGSFTQDFWSKDEKGWTVEVVGQNTEGKSITAKHRVTRLNADAFTFESTNRSRDGEKLPDLPPLELERVKSNLPLEKGTP